MPPFTHTPPPPDSPPPTPQISSHPDQPPLLFRGPAAPQLHAARGGARPRGAGQALAHPVLPHQQHGGQVRQGRGGVGLEWGACGIRPPILFRRSYPACSLCLQPSSDIRAPHPASQSMVDVRGEHLPNAMHTVTRTSYPASVPLPGAWLTCPVRGCLATCLPTCAPRWPPSCPTSCEGPSWRRWSGRTPSAACRCACIRWLCVLAGFL